MSQQKHEESSEENLPSFQKLYDRPFLWLTLGMIVMVVFYTAWGIFEMTNLTKAPLP
ncbi:MAG: hypothetical protein KF789_00010 [Bdellovibrionaceae bacterium]|nr:hypothetical protein [Pseudobdellovibrionaceae bacterium]